MSAADLQAITEILGAIAREPDFARFRVVAFGMDQQRILYRQPAASDIDFAALGQATDTLRTRVIIISPNIVSG
jgi:hypothetical protein